MDLGYADSHAQAILQCWYPGGRGGSDIAKILLGEEAPSGKLPVTFYRSLKTLPAFADYGMKGRTYRYIEETPLYPFGYGLTYGQLTLSDVSALRLKDGSARMCVTVSNAGQREVSDVLQIYAENRGTEFETPHPHLAAFSRVTVGPGETQKVEIEVPERAFTVVDLAGRRVHAGGGTRLFAGFGQPDTRTEELTGQECAVCEI